MRVDAGKRGRRPRLPTASHLGVTCHPTSRCRRQRRSWDAGPNTELPALIIDLTRAGLEAELAEQPVIIAGVGVGIGGRDGGQPVLYIQLGRSGYLRHVDAERPPQLPECASEGPAMKTPVGVVDAVASVGPHSLKEFPAGRSHRSQTLC
jgi:hypothetical protein